MPGIFFSNDAACLERDGHGGGVVIRAGEGDNAVVMRADEQRGQARVLAGDTADEIAEVLLLEVVREFQRIAEEGYAADVREALHEARPSALVAGRAHLAAVGVADGFGVFTQECGERGHERDGA